jgi:hypothetical protein
MAFLIQQKAPKSFHSCLSKLQSKLWPHLTYRKVVASLVYRLTYRKVVASLEYRLTYRKVVASLEYRLTYRKVVASLEYHLTYRKDILSDKFFHRLFHNVINLSLGFPVVTYWSSYPLDAGLS